jgi:hypothetical protein
LELLGRASCPSGQLTGVIVVLADDVVERALAWIHRSVLALLAILAGWKHFGSRRALHPEGEPTEWQELAYYQAKRSAQAATLVDSG